jgi:hypothetical protein
MEAADRIQRATLWVAKRAETDGPMASSGTELAGGDVGSNWALFALLMG